MRTVGQVTPVVMRWWVVAAIAPRTLHTKGLSPSIQPRVEVVGDRDGVDGSRFGLLGGATILAESSSSEDKKYP